MRRLHVVCASLASLSLGVLASCYTVDFDETRSEVYYCQLDTDCGSTQTCAQFRCVDDSGPHIRITLPEALTPFQNGTAQMVVDYEISNFAVVESNDVVEGEGKILIVIDDGSVVAPVISVTDAGAQVEISGLEAGPHRLWVYAIRGDESEYENPSAKDVEIFWVDNPSLPDPCVDCVQRPFVVIVDPPPGYVHVIGEDLEVTVATRGFAIVSDGDNCVAPADCDPFHPTQDCEMECTLLQEGHPHIYDLPDFPGCLSDQPIGCSGDYILSMRPTDAGAPEDTSTATISGSTFDTTGTIDLTASLQHSNHISYPNASTVVFDKITIEVIER